MYFKWTILISFNAFIVVPKKNSLQLSNICGKSSANMWGAVNDFLEQVFKNMKNYTNHIRCNSNGP